MDVTGKSEVFDNNISTGIVESMGGATSPGKESDNLRTLAIDDFHFSGRHQQADGWGKRYRIQAKGKHPPQLPESNWPLPVYH